MLNFEIVFQILHTHKVDALPIALTSLAGNLTIFAFAYPYIYKAIESIGKVSEILVQRIRKKILVKFYWLFLSVLFVLNISSFIWCFFTEDFYYWTAGIILILLLIHIFYVMKIYSIINEAFAVPLNYLIFKLNRNYKEDEKQKTVHEDIRLLQDLILFCIKTGFKEAELGKYTENFINITIYKFNNYLDNLLLKKEYFVPIDFLTSEGAKEEIDLFFPLNIMIYLNKRATDANNEEFIYYIDIFFQNLLYYNTQDKEIQKDKNFIQAYPGIMHPCDKLLEINKKNENQPNRSLYMQHDTIQHFCDHLNRNILNKFTYVISYRIEKKSFNNIYDIGNIISILFHSITNIHISNKYNVYKHPFSLVCELIDYNYSERTLTGILTIINKERFIELAKSWEKYKRIMVFHIIVLAYILFRNKYDLFLAYINFEESSEKVNTPMRPQIPSRIDVIFSCFIGRNNVFDDTKIFSNNVSSVKYKIFTLFVLLMNSKNIADIMFEKLSKISKENILYKYNENILKVYSEFSENFFNDMCWDEVLLTDSYRLAEYKKYLAELMQNNEIVNRIMFEKKHEKFINDKISEVVGFVDRKKIEILNTNIADLVKKDFSSQLQNEYNEYKVKNIDMYINVILSNILNNIMSIYSLKNLKDIEKTQILLANVEFDKKEFLYGIANVNTSIFSERFEEYIYTEMLDKLYKKCDKISKLSDISIENLSNYIVVSSSLSKDEFYKVMSHDNVVVDSKTNIVSEIKINGQKKEISLFLNRYFKKPDIAPCIMLIDKSKFGISKGNDEPIEFCAGSEENKILVLNKTPVVIQIHTNQPLGYILQCT